VGAGDLLREADRRLLPPLARWLDRLHRSGLGGHLRRPRPLTVAALASAASVAAVAVWTAADQPSPPPPMADPTRVGVAGGQSIPGYVASTRSELARLVAAGATGRAYALVTLKMYLPPSRLGPTLSGVEVAQVHARVPLPKGQTEIERIPVARVPQDVVAGMVAVAERMERDAAEYQSLSAKLTGDGREERRLRTAYAEGARLAAAEAAAYRSRCACVYAAVVQGAPAALEHVADRREVLAVDPAPEVRRLDQAVFVPPLPEQTGTTGPPTGRPAVTSPRAVRREHPASTGPSPSPPVAASSAPPVAASSAPPVADETPSPNPASQSASSPSPPSTLPSESG
jgi:hypothetical protein